MPSQALNWIGGRWIAARSHAFSDSFDPATGAVLGQYADSGAADVIEAIARARTAFDDLPWRHQPRARASVLLDFADRLQTAAPEIVDLLTAENGKLRRESEAELAFSVNELRYYAGLTRTISGRISELEPGQYSMIAREPMGVAAIIVPWNAPVILLMRSLAPALAAGCTVVVKSAPQTALSSERVMRVLSDVAGLPAGVVNMFAETGSEGARLLVSSPDVDVVSYTGSTHVGKQIMAAAAGTLKRLNLELGGSAPCIILPDASLDSAVPALVRAGMVMAGQQCVAASRLLVHQSIFDNAVDRFATRLDALRVGPGNRPESEMGPLIDIAARDRVCQLIEASRGRNDVILAGTVPPDTPPAGAFLSPSLIRIRDPSSEISCQETFGPILTIEPFADEREAVARANRGRFGLAASVWTADLAHGQRIASRVQSGTVWINSHGRLSPETETGGYKESGLGRLHGPQGLDEFLQSKHIAWDLGSTP